MQKPYVIIVLIFISILLLAGCNNSNQHETIQLYVKTPAITEEHTVSITALPIGHEEHTILKAGGVTHSFIFEINVNHAEPVLGELWVDKYVDGELVEADTGIKSQLTANTTTLLYVTQTSLDEAQEMWTYALRQEGNIGSSKQLRKLENSYSATMTSSIDAVSAEINDIVELGYLARNLESGLISYSTMHIEEMIRNNDEVFIIRCKVSLD